MEWSKEDPRNIINKPTSIVLYIKNYIEDGPIITGDDPVMMGCIDAYSNVWVGTVSFLQKITPIKKEDSWPENWYWTLPPK